MNDFDKVSYWRRRSMDRFETYLFDSRVMFNELRGNYVHVEGKVSPAWIAATNNIDQALTEFQNVLLTMGKPTKPVKEENEHKEEDTQIHKKAEKEAGEKEKPTTGGKEADRRA